VIEVLIEEGYFIEGRAEGVFELGVGSLEEEDVLMFLWQFFGEVDEGLLVGLLVGEGVFLEEVQGVGGMILDE